MKRTPLHRTRFMRSNRKSKYARRERDTEFMLWVKTLPCCFAYLGGCNGVVEADHAGRRGLGQKAPDTTCIPLCTLHHRQRTDFSGPFRSWDKERMREALERAGAHTRALWSALTGS